MKKVCFMERKIHTICICLFCCMVLASCNKAENDQKKPDSDLAKMLEETSGSNTEDEDNGNYEDEDEPDEEPSEDIKDKDEESADHEAVYAPVFDELLEVLDYGYNMDREYKYATGGFTEAVMYPGEDDLYESIGYLFRDVNGDGIPELLVGSDESGPKSYIYGLYSLKEGEPVTVFAGSARSSYQSLGKDHFYYQGSGGAAITIFGENHLSKDGTELVWDDFYFTDEKDDGEIGVFYNDTGIFDINKADELNMSEEKFSDKMDSYSDKCESIPWTPIGDYKEGKTKESGKKPDTDKKSGKNNPGLSADEAAEIADNLGGMVCVLERHDYDGDGLMEAYAALGEYDDMGGYLLKSVWFIYPDGKTKEMRNDFNGLSMYKTDERGYYLEYKEENKGFFTAECGGYGSGWFNLIFSVKDGEPYELDLSMKTEGFYQDEPGVFYTLTDDYTEWHRYMITELEYDRKTEQFIKGMVTDKDWMEQ